VVDGVRELAKRYRIFVVTADTFGSARNSLKTSLVSLIIKDKSIG